MAKSAEVSFDSAPWTEMISSIRERWQDVEDRKKFGAIVSVAVYTDIIDHFSKQSGPEGGWQKWSTAYANHMRRVGKGGNMILQDSGKLRMSFLPSNWRGTGAGLVFYNNAKTKGGFPYAAAHDEGGPKLPQRQFMWLSDKGMDQIIDLVERWLNPLNGDDE